MAKNAIIHTEFTLEFKAKTDGVWTTTLKLPKGGKILEKFSHPDHLHLLIEHEQNGQQEVRSFCLVKAGSPLPDGKKEYIKSFHNEICKVNFSLYELKT